ncbi:hypothetical protein GALMADRAFT_141907 [Galerina marginata CBS 339.88]|uniref:Uncharacterized protein n=1 Tax=Galerina marginata (strain CBS 339.88) TaxID=685588 RepID=A0A067SR37_GALM3|nr:hypothetical protein GALMADRAFT_141907 [Galerina marginata CBS 339.88]
MALKTKIEPQRSRLSKNLSQSQYDIPSPRLKVARSLKSCAERMGPSLSPDREASKDSSGVNEGHVVVLAWSLFRRGAHNGWVNGMFPANVELFNWITPGYIEMCSPQYPSKDTSGFYFECLTEADTGIPVRFYHIHGSGFRTWIADAHKGQALGVGMFCQRLCEKLTGYCLIETSRRLKDLSPYDHLRRFFRLCTIHFKRYIHELWNSLPADIISAMYSLISSEPLPDFDGTCKIISKGGPKAKAWLKDKIDAKFVIAAIYRPHSLISLIHWLASPPSTNGNEQSHRSINRDGILLTLLGGICRALQYDFRSMATDYRRSQTSINRQVAVQRRVQDKKSPSKKAQKKSIVTHPQHQSLSSTMPGNVNSQNVV